MIPRRHAAAVLALVREILDDGRARAAADPSLVCANCGSACEWFDPNGLCGVCAVADYTSDPFHTWQIVADLVGASMTRHERLVRRLARLMFDAERESFPRQLCTFCGDPCACDPDESIGWHHLSADHPACWLPCMSN